MQQHWAWFMVVVLAVVLWRRTAATRRPIRGNGLRLVMPVLFILPGLLMFTAPNAHPTALEIVFPVVLGCAMSIPMIVTTNYEVREDGQIYAKKSLVFIVTFVAMVVVRVALRNYFQTLGPMTGSLMVYLVAVAYVVPWRIASYVKFRTVRRLTSVEV